MSTNNNNNSVGKAIICLPLSPNTYMSLHSTPSDSLSTVPSTITSTENKTKQHKNQKINGTTNKNNNKSIIIHNLPHSPPPQTPPFPNDRRRWQLIGGNVLQILRNPPQTPSWHPNPILPTERHTVHPFGRLLQQQFLSIIPYYCQGHSDTIIRSYRKPDMHITTKDLRDVISPNNSIYHENLILSLELLCSFFQGSYLDPSFYPTLRTQGWIAVKRRFSCTDAQSTIDKPSFTQPIIAFPIHVGGNHWTALCRRIINGATYFYYADDLNNVQLEQTLKNYIFRNTDQHLCPPTSQWVSCTTPNYHPHHNECGPRTILALAVMMSHPAPHQNMLHPYMTSNLAQYSRIWMGLLLTSGVASLLPPEPVNTSPSLHATVIQATPFNLLPWEAAGSIASGPHPSSKSTLDLKPNPSPSIVVTTVPPQASQHSQLAPLLDIKQSTLPIIIGEQKPLLEPPSSVPPNHTTLPIPHRKKGKQLQPPNQLSLFDTKICQPNTPLEAPEFWGHNPDAIDEQSTFRVFFNNPSGLKISTDPTSVHYSLSLLAHLGVGAICLAETNINWGKSTAMKLVKDTFKKVWRHSTVMTSYKKEAFDSINQPGGTLTSITGNWTSRVIERGVDPFHLGRWSYIVLRGKNGIKILLVTAYRVCTQTVASIGPNTSTAQQFRGLSERFRHADLTHDPKPRHQFIVDLQAWLETKIASDYSIVLSIDANESLQPTVGTYTPLNFTLEKPIPIKGHDGTLATLLHTCGLRDPLTIQHTEHPPPPTYNRGKDRIDYIFVSAGLLPAVQRTGIFPYDHIFISDHRPCFIDFDSGILFQDGTPPIAPHIYRGLQTFDPRLVALYEKTIMKQVKYHKLDEKISTLLEKAETTTWDANDTRSYESVDKLFTEAMLSAERDVSKKVSTTYAWSPVLKRAVSALRYWELSLKRANGRVIPDSILLRYQAEANIDVTTLSQPLRLPEVVQQLRQARTTLYAYQRQHLSLRANHLLSLAEARLLVRDPSLIAPSKAAQFEKRRDKELKRIIRREANKQLHRKIGFVLHPNTYTGGLSSIDVPSLAPPYPIGPDPKTWNGPWYTITNPTDLARHIAATNARQYNQAHTTPFGQEPLQSYVGYKGDQPGAESLIHGELPPPHIMSALLPETQALLHYLTTCPRYHPPYSSSISGDQFQSLYRSLDERTSSSPSGRHLGHYRTAAQSDILSSLHASMMSIPYLTGISPSRWRQTIDVMLEKKQGDRRIHRLRIVALQESDFNQANRLLIGRPLLHALEDHNHLPDIQYGSRPSKMCHSPVLNKVLTYEIHRYNKRPLAYIENDAVGCYDRIINPLVLIFLRILGLSKPLVASLANTWEATYHRIKTLYGISGHQYTNHPLYLLYGPGQGSTIGPFLWLLCFLLIFNSLSLEAPRITIQSIDRTQTIKFIGEAFVDDSGLGTNLTDDEAHGLTSPEAGVEGALIQRLQTLAQEWERLLYSTGGALNLQKCFWFIMSWRWKGSIATLHTQLTLPAQLTMTSGQDPTPTTIPRIEPTSSFRTLGVFITPSGSNKGAISVLKDITVQFATNITGSHLSRQEALTAYIQYLLPKLRYQPPLLSLSQSECNQLQSTTLMALLPKLNVNRHTARSIIHGPEELGGMDLPHIYTTQGVEKLKLFLGHLRLQDRTGLLLHCDLALLQLLSGTGHFILNQEYKHYRWLEQGWLTSLWEFLNQVKFTLFYPSSWLPTLTRRSDSYLMEIFHHLHLPQPVMAKLNRCRLFLQVITLSDITSADGTYILPTIKNGTLQEDRISMLMWPHQGRPTKSEWLLWDQTLQHFELRNKLLIPLGEWRNPSHQSWQYFIHPTTLVVYHKLAGFVTRCFPPVVILNPRTRAQHRPWYDFQQSYPLQSSPQDLYPATIEHNNILHGSLFQVNYHSSQLPLFSPSTPPADDALYTALLDLSQYPIPLQKLQEAAVIGHLVVICGSNYDTQASLTTATISFIATEELYTYTTLALSSADRLRAEFLSIMLALFVISRFTPNHPITNTITISSNNKRAHRQAFSNSPLGLREAVQANYDILLEIRHLRKLIPIPLRSLYAPRTNAGVENPSLAPPLLQLLVQQQQTTIVHAPMTHTISVQHNGKVLVSNLLPPVKHELHYSQLQTKLQRDNGWTAPQFHSVDWPAYRRALRKLPRSHRISIAKLSHQLWQTNKRQKKFYNYSDLCPYCQSEPESILHIFTCTHLVATKSRDDALAHLFGSLKADTPPFLLSALCSGIRQWIAHPNLPAYVVPTEIIAHPQAAILVAAFHAQTHVGWGALFRGHMVTHWSSAYKCHYQPKTKKSVAPATITKMAQQWSSKLINSMWHYSKSLWSSRNEVVHGKTSLSQSQEVLRLHTAIRQHYEAYSQDPHYVPTASSYLFRRPLDSFRRLRRDTLSCWLQSVEEAVLTQQHRIKLLHRSLDTFFRKRQSINSARLRASSDFVLWRPPFSAAYYATQRSKNSKQVFTGPRPLRKRNLVPRSMIQSTLRPTSCRPRLTLHHFGFHLNSPRPPNMDRRHRDQQVKKIDYSGTLVSTVP